MLSANKPTGHSEETQEAADSAGEEETQRLNVEIPKSLHKRLQMEKVRSGQTIKEIVQNLIDEGIE